MKGSTATGLKAAGLTLLALTLVVGAGATARVVAAPRSIDGLVVAAPVAGTPEAFWFGQMNRDGICRLIAGCISATGEDPNWVFQIRMDVPGIGMQTIPVSVTLSEQVPQSSMRFALSSTSSAGTLDGDVRLSVAPAGSASRATLELTRIQATGFAQAVLPQLQADLPAFFQSQMSSLTIEQATAGTKVRLVLSAGTKATARVTVTGASLTRQPPVATGTLRVLVGSKVVCTAPVRNSRGTCRFAAPARGSLVRAVVTGTFSNGMPLWSSATGRYR